MTKVMTLALLIGTLALVGCDNNKKTSVSKNNGAVPAPAAESAPPPSGTLPPGGASVPPPTPSAEAGPGPDTVAAAPAGGKVYVVKAGDTFSKIARAHGVKLHDLKAANPGVNPDVIKPGQKINLP